jgi:pSer/pThr/pTyr-binding forkhead associated (FHA) protein
MSAAVLAVPTLRIRTGELTGKVYEVKQALRLGRHPYNDVSLGDAGLSRYHCWFTATDTGIFIEDLTSTNGTYVNGQRVQIRRRLSPGDVVRVGSTEFLFSEEE